MTTKIFFDTEFTGLHQNTTLISIGLISECGKTFYGELNDYDKKQINKWLNDNIINHLGKVDENIKDENNWISIGNKNHVKNHLIKWLKQFDKVEMWSDCLAYDWVLFNEFLADFDNGYPKLPENIYYMSFDILPLFHIKGIDPDIKREDFVKELINEKIEKHNSLWDAKIIQKCYNKLMDYNIDIDNNKIKSFKDYF